MLRSLSTPKDFSELTDELVGFELAKLLKEKSFEIGLRSTYRQSLFAGTDEDWEGVFPEGEVFEDFGSYHINDKVGLDRSNEAWEIYARPTQSLVQRWLREKHNIHVFVKTPAHNWQIWFYDKPEPRMQSAQPGKYRSYEQALEDALKVALAALPDLIPADLAKKFDGRAKKRALRP